MEHISVRSPDSHRKNDPQSAIRFRAERRIRKGEQSGKEGTTKHNKREIIHCSIVMVNVLLLSLR